MGIFDFFKGKKKQVSTKKEVVINKDLNKEPLIIYKDGKKIKHHYENGQIEEEVQKISTNEKKDRVNDDSLEDIGIVTHFKGIPFTGIAVITNKRNNNITDEIEMLEGLKHGDYFKYHPTSGKLSKHSNYFKDLIDGEQIHYNVDSSKITLKSYYKKGVFIKSYHYNSNGEIIEGQLDWFESPINLYNIKIRKFGLGGVQSFSPRLIWLKPIPASIFISIVIASVTSNFDQLILNFKKYFEEDYNYIFDDETEIIQQVKQYKILTHSSFIAENIPKGILIKDLTNKKYLSIIKSDNKKSKKFLVIDNSIKPTGIVFESNEKDECNSWINRW